MKFVCLLILCGGLVLPASALDREAFTITKYDLAISLEPQQQRLGARGRITLRNDSGHAQNIVALQISSSLNWRSIRVEGKPVQFVSQPYFSDIDHTGALSEAIVSLPADIKPQGSLEIEIGYEGVIPLDATRLTRIGVPDEIAKHSSWDQISPSFTALRGAGYVAWYPIATESADFSEGNSLFEVTDRWHFREAQAKMKISLCSAVSGAKAPSIVVNAPAGSADNGGATDGHICRAIDFARLGAVSPTFAVAEYVSHSKLQVELLSLPGHEAGAGTYLSALDPAAKFVSGWFGEAGGPVTIADFPDPHSVPFESGTLLMASMAAEDAKLAGINLVHELVHSALPSSTPWVYEGLAHFGEALYRQQQGGRQAALDLLGLHRAAFVDSEKEVSAALQKNVHQANIGQPLAHTFDETYYRSKAAYVWWMLRDMIGDDALQRALRNYRLQDDTAQEPTQYPKQDPNKDPKYMERLIEAASRRDLGWFFDDWVYFDRGLPDIHVQSVHPWKTEKGAQIVTITLENLGSAGAEVPFTVLFAGGEITKRLEVRARGTATTRVESPLPATEIVLNDGSVPEDAAPNRVFQITAALSGSSESPDPATGQ